MSLGLPLIMLTVASCGGGSNNICATHTCCGGQSASSTETAPTINNFEFLYQLPEDPTLAVYGIDFQDADGDLYQGKLEVYVGSASSPSFSADMATIYTLSSLSLGSTEGRFALPQSYKLSTDDDGKYAIVSLQVTDGMGQKSNCKALSIQFEVSHP